MPKKPPLYPHVPKSRRHSLETKPTRDDVSVNSWQERDRLGIWITDNRTGKTIAEWWDDGARQMFEDGFFKPATFTRAGELGGPEFIDSVLDYAESIGLLEVEAPHYYHCTNIEKHPGNIVVQIRTTLKDPKCPYCGAIMTYGKYW